jgi:hypothetical protein
MKKLLYFAAVVIAATASVSTATSCKFAPSQNDGDTVAEDTSALHAKKMARIKAQKAMTDSVGIYYIGSGSSKEKLQLVSYPSRRDTFEYGKTRRIKVKGCADINHVVRVDFYLLNGKDSLVKAVEEITQQ